MGTRPWGSGWGGSGGPPSAPYLRQLTSTGPTTLAVPPELEDGSWACAVGGEGGGGGGGGQQASSFGCGGGNWLGAGCPAGPNCVEGWAERRSGLLDLHGWHRHGGGTAGGSRAGAAAGGGLPVAALAVAAGAHPQVLKEVHLQGQQLRTVCLEVASWVLSQVLPEVQRQGRLLQGRQPQVPEAGS